MKFESRVLTHFSGVWGPLWKQNTCTLQFLMGGPLEAEYLLMTCFVAHYEWIMRFSPKIRKIYARNTSRGGPRKVPRSPPLKHTTEYKALERILPTFHPIIFSALTESPQFYVFCKNLSFQGNCLFRKLFFLLRTKTDDTPSSSSFDFLKRTSHWKYFSVSSMNHFHNSMAQQWHMSKWLAETAMQRQDTSSSGL